jgi:hypothetical protein
MGIWLKPFVLSQIDLIIFSSPLKTNELFHKIVENKQLAELGAPSRASTHKCGQPGL